jgi:hypothetical protein
MSRGPYEQNHGDTGHEVRCQTMNGGRIFKDHSDA